MTVRLAATPARATILLHALGQNAEQVAARLTELRITGRPGMCGSCPIAIYLLQSDLGIYDVTIDGHVTLWYRDDDGVTHVDEVPLPSACERFIELFDEGYYRHLAVTR